ncbi:MAG: MraY family glycosyltransferase [Elusimicrobiota bacterium]
MIIFVFFLLSLALSLVSVYFFKIFAEKVGFYDIPKNELKDHKAPVPYAGTAIFIAFMVTMAALRFFTHFETGTLYRIRGIIYGGSIIYLLGLFDDIFDLDFRVKFFWQTVAAVILIHFGIYIKLFANMPLNIAVSVFWVILVSNAVNIIDILDGLAGGVAAIAAIGFFAVTLPTKMFYVNFTAIILFGVLLGFWFFNKPPAKAFMGDAGSLFVGFVLASLSMGADYSSVNIIGLFSPILILGLPLFDTILVSCFRFKNKQSVFKGSRDHYALRLTVAGFSPWQIDMISYGISFMLCLGAFGMTVLSRSYAFLILVFVFLLGMVGSSMLGNIDISEK